jgi:hypothetical protein
MATDTLDISGDLRDEARRRYEEAEQKTLSATRRNFVQGFIQDNAPVGEETRTYYALHKVANGLEGDWHEEFTLEKAEVLLHAFYETLDRME